MNNIACFDTKINYLLPKSLDIKLLESLFTKKNKLESVYKFLSLIFKPFNHDQKVEDFRNIHYRTIEATLPKRSASDILKTLIQSDLIESDYDWHIGSKSTGYRIKYLKSWDYQIVECSNKKPIKNHEKLCPIGKWICNNFKNITCKDLPDTFNDLTHLRWEDIKSKNFSFKECAHGRLHYPLTNLDRRARPYLSYQNEQLFQIDIKSSQPYLLSLILPYLYHLMYPSYPLTLYVPTFSHEATKIISNILKCNIHPPCTLYVPTFCQFEEFKKLTLNDLYEQIGSLFNVDRSIEREVGKEQYMKYFYADPKYVYLSEVYNFMEERFPLINQLIILIKSIDYRWLSHLMQRVESDFIIRKLMKEIMVKYPESFVLTIHDSIITTKEYLDLFKEMFYNEFYQYFGESPILKVSKL